MNQQLNSFIELRRTTRLSYSALAHAHEVPEPLFYKLAQAELRSKWSSAFEGLSPRVRNALASEHITMMCELRILHENMQLLTIPNFGPKCYHEVTQFLATSQ